MRATSTMSGLALGETVRHDEISRDNSLKKELFLNSQHVFWITPRSPEAGTLLSLLSRHCAEIM